MNIYVASGVTSNLFSTLISLKFIPTSVRIYATARPTSNTLGLEQCGVKFVDSVDQVPNVHRILWLSTHDDVELLTKLATIAPTLVISSGAIMDFVCGKQSEESLNPYQRSKLSIMRFPGVTKFVPGFFLEDMPLTTWAPKGLHGDTTQRRLTGPSVTASRPSRTFARPLRRGLVPTYVQTRTLFLPTASTVDGSCVSSPDSAISTQRETQGRNPSTRTFHASSLLSLRMKLNVPVDSHDVF